VIDENLAHFGEMERRAREGLDWPADEVIPPELTRSDLRAMYEDFHRHNLDVMRAGLRGQ
jgi:hypothetical protein